MSQTDEESTLKKLLIEHNNGDKWTAISKENEDIIIQMAECGQNVQIAEVLTSFGISNGKQYLVADKLVSKYRKTSGTYFRENGCMI